MTDAAVFRATIHGLKTVPTRKVCQITVEAPIEQLSEIARIAEHGAWVAVARINESAEQAPQRETQSVASSVPAGAKSRAQVFGYLCTTIPFQKFLKDKFSDQWHSHIAQVAEDGADDWGAESAARTVRQLCGVTSRSKITKDNADASALLLAWQLWSNHPELEDA